MQRFRGMFAFALWDRKQQTLFIVRDRLGVKPLFYSVLPDETLIFASELKALVAHPGFDKSIDPLAVEEYFAYGYIPEPRTIYRSAFKLEPGFTLTLKVGQGLPQPKQW